MSQSVYCLTPPLHPLNVTDFPLLLCVTTYSQECLFIIFITFNIISDSYNNLQLNDSLFGFIGKSSTPFTNKVVIRFFMVEPLTDPNITSYKRHPLREVRRRLLSYLISENNYTQLLETFPSAVNCIVKVLNRIFYRSFYKFLCMYLKIVL